MKSSFHGLPISLYCETNLDKDSSSSKTKTQHVLQEKIMSRTIALADGAGCGIVDQKFRGVGKDRIFRLL